MILEWKGVGDKRGSTKMVKEGLYIEETCTRQNFMGGYMPNVLVALHRDGK